MKKAKLFGLILISTMVMACFQFGANADAAPFNANNIIDDSIFDDVSTMGAGDVNAFLNRFVYSCISPNSGFSARVPSGYSPNGGFTYGNYATAGEVIVAAAQVYRLNPQVLITTLEKEQSLVTGRNSSSYCSPSDDNNHKYASAVGYGCPDSGTSYTYTTLDLYRRNGVTQTNAGPTCVNSASKAGFSQQVVRAAWLLKFGEQRSKGNVGWAVVSGSWDNSDDAQSCYGGPMTQGTFARCPSGAGAYYDGYVTIDGTAVHMDSGATAALYWYTPHFHGNQVFNDLFVSWFGDTHAPFAFKSPSSDVIYMYISGYKIAVPAMGILQDYGISPQSIQTVSQARVDAIPTPSIASTGISPTLSYVVKSSSDTDADGGALYLVSVGRKYQIKSMTQFNDFGFSTDNIGYLPLSYIQSLSGNSQLSNFITTPTASAFQVSGGQKRIIFDYSTYKNLNPSDISTYVSYFTADLVASGNPLTGGNVMVKYTNSDVVYLLTNNTYYAVTTADAYNCWGLSSTLNIPLYQLVNNNYVATILPASNLQSCLVKSNSGTNYLMGRTAKYVIPNTAGIAIPQATATNLLNIANGMPTNTSDLTPYIRGKNTPAVFYLEGGFKKHVPTYSNFVLLNITAAQLTYLDESAMSAIPSSGIKLGVGQVVKANDNPSVYVVSGNTRLQYARSDDFVAFRNGWENIESYSATTLDQFYPYQGTIVSPYLFDQSSNAVFLVDKNGCYKLSDTQQTAFAQTRAGLSTGQAYNAAIFVNLNLESCKIGSQYVKDSSSAAVYLIEGGQKRQFSSWTALTTYSQQSNPYIINVSPANLNVLPTGSSI